MTTFEEFVSVVHTNLLKRYPSSDVALASVQQVLSQIDINNALQQKTSIAPPKRLRLRRLRISGHKHKLHSANNTNTPFIYDCHLGEGINGWIAGNGTGKSTILKSIVWGLTGVEQPFKQDIRSWIEDVSLEIAIANATYIIRYFPRIEQPRVSGIIVEQDIDTMLKNEAIPQMIASFSGTTEMIENIDKFFSERLYFTPLQLDRADTFLAEDAEKIVSWQIYSQALFIGSDYTDYLFPKNSLPGRPHQKTLSTYLGLGSTEILTKLELGRDKARDDYKFEMRRVTVNAQEVQKKIEDLQTELRFVDERIKSIDEGHSVLVDPAYLSEVQEKIAQHTTHIVDLSTTEQQLLKEERETQKKIDDKRRACQELQEAIQFRVFLSGLTIERCPHCEQELAAERIEEEIQKKQCGLCYSELRPVQSIEQYKFLLDETQETIKKLEHDLKTIRKELNKALSMRREEENNRAHWRNELQDLPRQERNGFTQEIRGLIDQRGNLNGQLTQLQAQTAEVHSEKLETALTEMQALIWRQYAIHWNSLEERTTELAKLFGITDLELISFRFGDSFDLFVKQGGRHIRYRNMEASEMLRLKLAFHLAMLIVGTTNGLGRHPGLLIVDAPGGAEMDEQHLQDILQGFSDIRHQVGAEMQVLIASTKESIASICEQSYLDQAQENSTLF